MPATTAPAKPKPERAWICLAGEAPKACEHAQIDRVQLTDMNQVTCLTCGHEWREVES